MKLVVHKMKERVEVFVAPLAMMMVLLVLVMAMLVVMLVVVLIKHSCLCCNDDCDGSPICRPGRRLCLKITITVTLNHSQWRAPNMGIQLQAHHSCALLFAAYLYELCYIISSVVLH